MNNDVAEQLLAKVMGWKEADFVEKYRRDLQLLATHKYDNYQRFSPGQRFIENLALWLLQMKEEHRTVALNFVMDRLVYFGDAELLHLVQCAYPDFIVPERIRMVSEEIGIPSFRVEKICKEPRFRELGLKSLYLGLSDGSRTSEIRRMSRAGISHEQIWQAYELGEQKGKDLLEKLAKSLASNDFPSSDQHFTLVWLLDDFSGSGNTYIRPEGSLFAGKITKIYHMLHEHALVDRAHYEVILLLYIATKQAVDHIEYWSERFTSSKGYKPLRVRVIHLLEDSVSVRPQTDAAIQAVISEPAYYDSDAQTNSTAVGGTTDVRRGFANCALPVILSHNTPNNSLYVLWGHDDFKFKGLFPRVSRHAE